MIGQDLYRNGYPGLLLKCITKKKAVYIIPEIHEGVCGSHSGRRMMTAIKAVQSNSANT